MGTHMITSRARMPRPFAPPGTRTNFVADRPVPLAPAPLGGAIHPAGRPLVGVARLTLTVRRDRITAVTLDAVDLEVASVTLDGRPAPFHHDGERLRIEFAGPQTEGTTVVAAVRYACRPVRGLYFVGPDAEHPDRPHQCWTQGQDDDSRYYWPCIDQPI